MSEDGLRDDALGLCDGVRRDCAEIAVSARSVAIDVDREARLAAALAGLAGAPEPALDPERHYLEGSAEDMTAYLLALDTINFGSGWFPTLRKRPAARATSPSRGRSPSTGVRRARGTPSSCGGSMPRRSRRCWARSPTTS